MAETLFMFDKRNYLECQTAFRGSRNEEYYLGDYSIEASSTIDVRADKKAVGACSIIRLRSKCKLSFKRNWSHIREDGTDVAVLWFVKRGRLSVSHQCGQSIANVGDFVITKSTTPFEIECLTDNDSMHEVLHVIVPTHVLRRFIPQDVRTGFSAPREVRELAIAERILTDIFDDADELSEHVTQLLVDSALLVLSDAIKSRDGTGPARQSIAHRRLQDVLKYIDVHLSDSKLCIGAVAKGCGISPRYLSFLLKLHGTPFSTLVWDKRLEAAGRWLAASKPDEASISEVAYKVGFKSPAHFSRMFKRAFKMSPRAYRVNAAGQIPRPQLPVSAAAVATAQ